METAQYSIIVDEPLEVNHAALTPAMRDLCQDVELVSVSEVAVTEEEFQSLIDGGVVRVPRAVPQPPTRKKRQTMGTCNDIQIMECL